MRGVLSLVLLSLDEEPRSDNVARSGVDGAAGTTESDADPFDVIKVPEFVGVRFAPTE
jgi:hypothetical protein